MAQWEVDRRFSIVVPVRPDLAMSTMILVWHGCHHNLPNTDRELSSPRLVSLARYCARWPYEMNSPVTFPAHQIPRFTQTIPTTSRLSRPVANEWTQTCNVGPPTPFDVADFLEQTNS